MSDLSIDKQVKEIPLEPGVYLMKNDKGLIIYIGKAKVLRKRVQSYFTKIKDRPNRLKHLVKQISTIDYIVTSSEVEAFLLEATLIKKHRPRYNIRLKDDKSYPYIKCTFSEDFPRFYLSRKVNKGKDLYYGPFTSSYLVRENIKFLNGLYKIRDCSNGFMKSRKRPCLTYEIKRCTAPCVDYVTRTKYKNQIKKALKFLEGETQEIIQNVETKMYKAAEKEEFERAADYRDQLKAAQIILEKQSMVSQEKIDRDTLYCLSDGKGFLISIVHARKGRVIGQKSHFLSRLQTGVEDYNLREKIISFLNQYYVDNFIPDEVLIDHDLGRDLTRLLKDVLTDRKGSDVFVKSETTSQTKAYMDMAQKNAEAQLKKFIADSKTLETGLNEIQKRFSLPQFPERIECYDISNFQGDQSVGSQVVFYNGSPSPEDYRIYKIKSVEGPDDFNSLKEVLSRRLGHKEYPDPQLILIDGGKGQVSKVVAALKDLEREDLQVVGIAKSREKGSFEDTNLQRSQERFFLPGQSNPIVFKSHHSALKILTHLRDEAHRFALTHHRKKREKKTLESDFLKLEGIGPVKFKALQELLKDKSSWTEICLADVQKTLKISEELAVKVLSLLKKNVT